MIIFISAILALFAFLLLTHWLWAKAKPKVSMNWVILAAAILIGSLGLLIAMGRVHWLAGAGTAILPFLRRGLSLIRFAPLLTRVFQGTAAGSATNPFSQIFGFSQNQESSAPETSETETTFLRMQLNHTSGELDGEVKTGAFANRKLSSLEKSELVELYNAIDEESKRLLGAFIQRYHPDLASDNTESDGENKETSSGTMTTERARRILGVDEHAGKQEIVDAHRRLMQKNHPDRGGSEFLASEINLAKDTLLKLI